MIKQLDSKLDSFASCFCEESFMRLIKTDTSEPVRENVHASANRFIYFAANARTTLL